MNILINVIIFEASCQAEASPSVSSFLEKIVINETERTPSAKRSLNKLGARKAIRKIPRVAVPNKSLNKISLLTDFISQLQENGFDLLDINYKHI